MEFSQNHNIPRGYHFHPTDEQLISYYLTLKVSGEPIPAIPDIVMDDVELYGPSHAQEPWELFRGLCKPNVSFYVFSKLEPTSLAGKRIKRVAGRCTWDLQNSHNVVSSGDGDGKAVIGLKRMFRFEMKEARERKVPRWIMHEYTLSGVPNYALCEIRHVVSEKEISGRRVGSEGDGRNWVGSGSTSGGGGGESGKSVRVEYGHGTDSFSTDFNVQVENVGCSDFVPPTHQRPSVVHSAVDIGFVPPTHHQRLSVVPSVVDVGVVPPTHQRWLSVAPSVVDVGFVSPTHQRLSVAPSVVGFVPPTHQRPLAVPSAVNADFVSPTQQRSSVVPNVVDARFMSPTHQQQLAVTSVVKAGFVPPTHQRQLVVPTVVNDGFVPPTNQCRLMSPSAVDAYFVSPTHQSRLMLPSAVDADFVPPTHQCRLILPSAAEADFVPPTHQGRLMLPSAVDGDFAPEGPMYPPTTERVMTSLPEASNGYIGDVVLNHEGPIPLLQNGNVVNSVGDWDDLEIYLNADMDSEWFDIVDLLVLPSPEDRAVDDQLASNVNAGDVDPTMVHPQPCFAPDQQ